MLVAIKKTPTVKICHNCEREKNNHSQLKDCFLRRDFCYDFKREVNVHRVWMCSVKTPNLLKGWRCGNLKSKKMCWQILRNFSVTYVNVILHSFMTTLDAVATLFSPKNSLGKSWSSQIKHQDLFSGLQQRFSRTRDLFATHCSGWKSGG